MTKINKDIKAPGKTVVREMLQLSVSSSATTAVGIITISGPDGTIVIDHYALNALCDRLRVEIGRAAKQRDQLIERARLEAERLADEAAERDARDAGPTHIAAPDTTK